MKNTNDFTIVKNDSLLGMLENELKQLAEKKMNPNKSKVLYVFMMSTHSTSETGHAVNLDHYKLLYDTNVGFGLEYNPSNAAIKLPAMLIIYNNAKAKQTALNDALGASKIPTGDRQDFWADKSKLVTRIYNEAKSSSCPPLIIKDLKALADKFRGEHKDHPLPPIPPPIPTPETISTSHMSYVMRTDTFQQIIAILTDVTEYAPTQGDLTILALTTLHTAMQTMNDNYGITVLNPVNNARIVRDKAFYGEIGMLQNAQLSKEASRAHFGATSPSTHTVTSIDFRWLNRI